MQVAAPSLGLMATASPQPASSVAIPRSIADINEDWLGAALGEFMSASAYARDLEGVDSVTALTGGCCGLTARTAIRCKAADGNIVARTLIVKFLSPSALPAECEEEADLLPVRELGCTLKETSFYRDFGGKGIVACPQVYLNLYDDATGGFCLVMEDLTEGSARQMYSVVGGQPVESMEQAAQELGAMQARVRSIVTGKWPSWLWAHDPSEATRTLEETNAPLFAQKWEAFKAASGKLPASWGMHECLIAAGDRLAAGGVPAWEEWVFEPLRIELPPTLSLWDTHPGNIAAGSGGALFFDFQFVQVGSPLYDLSLLLTTSLKAPGKISPAEARRVLRDAYLPAEGRSLSEKLVWRHFQLCCFLRFMFNVVWLRDFWEAAEDRSALEHIEALVGRHTQAYNDLRIWEALPGGSATRGAPA